MSTNEALEITKGTNEAAIPYFACGGSSYGGQM